MLDLVLCRLQRTGAKKGTGAFAFFRGLGNACKTADCVNFGMRCILVRMRMRLLNSFGCDYLTNHCDCFVMNGKNNCENGLID